MDNLTKVLLIEDDMNLAFMLSDGLDSEGFDVQHIQKGEEAMRAFRSYSPDIVLLDVNLKGAMTGFDVSKELRKKSDIPIIFTTSRSQIADLQEGFQIGNVDYLKKPYSIRELNLRIFALLSRYREMKKIKNASGNSIRISNYVFSPEEQTLQNIDTIHLQKYESDVLAFLCYNMDKVVSKKEILTAIWGADLQAREASLYNILFSLRNKLSGDPTISIQTIPKAGYKLTISPIDDIIIEQDDIVDQNEGE